MNYKKNLSNPNVSQIRIAKNPLEDFKERLKSRLRATSLRLAVDLMEEELFELCGPKFSRKALGGLCSRTGSDPGTVLLRGQRVKVQKPRGRDFKGEEIKLDSYEALRDFDLLSNDVTASMLRGVSTRNYDELLEEVEGGVGLSKATVSRAFKRGSKKMLDELTTRDLSKYVFVSMMIDGVEVDESSVVTVLGITEKGKKLILGIKEGSTENSDVVKDLFANLVERGLKTNMPMLFVLDGAKALKKAVQALFGKDTLIQRCVRHKERNVLSYLPEKFHLEFRRRWKKLHGMKNYDEAKKEHSSLLKYLQEINLEAASSLEESGLETLTVVRLGVPDLLRKTLLSTNPIESVFNGFRRRSKRVTNWKTGMKGYQIRRWVASSLLLAEKNFRTLRGFAQIPVLITALANSRLQIALEVA
jgi:transposase-like protein